MAKTARTDLRLALAWLTGGIWERLRELESQKPELADDIRGVADAVTGGSAKSTVTAYTGWLRKFAAYCRNIGVPLEEVKSAEVAMFLSGMVNHGYSGSSIAQAQAAISWAAQAADRDDPTKNRAVSQVVATGRRNSKEVVRATPVTLQHIMFLYDWSIETKSFVSKRTLLLCMCLFLGFARWADIAKITIDDVLIEEDCVTLELHKLKNNQFSRDANQKYLPKAEQTNMCVVELFKEWLALPKVGKTKGSPLFPGSNDPQEPVTYSVFHDNLRDAQRNSPLPLITSHSFRSGASSSAANSFVPAADLAMAGGWKQQSSTTCYIQSNKAKRLAIAKPRAFEVCRTADTVFSISGAKRPNFRLGKPSLETKTGAHKARILQCLVFRTRR